MARKTRCNKEIICDAARDRGLTLCELADSIGINRNTFYGKLSNRITFSPEERMRLCDALDADSEDLFPGVYDVDGWGESEKIQKMLDEQDAKKAVATFERQKVHVYEYMEKMRRLHK